MTRWCLGMAVGDWKKSREVLKPAHPPLEVNVCNAASCICCQKILSKLATIFSSNHIQAEARNHHGSLNVPIEHHPTIRYMVYNGYYKVMSNIPKMGQLPTPDHFFLTHGNGAQPLFPNFSNCDTKSMKMTFASPETSVALQRSFPLVSPLDGASATLQLDGTR